MWKAILRTTLYLLVQTTTVDALTVRFDPPNNTIISSSSSIYFESVGATHLCYTTSGILPQCKSGGINATAGCILGSTKILAESYTYTTTSETTARIAAVGCVGLNTTSTVSAVNYDISASAGIVQFDPSPSSGNVKIGTKITVSSTKATYLCIATDGTTPTCADGGICGVGKVHSGDRAEVTIEDGIYTFYSFDVIGCTTKVQGASESAHVQYTTGPVAGKPMFQIEGDHLNTSTSGSTTIVRSGAKINATSNSSTIVCLRSWLVKSSDDAAASPNTTPPNTTPPTCNIMNGTCGIGSSSDAVSIISSGTTVVSAIGCTLASDAGTNSLVVQSRYNIGKIVKPVTASPSKKGKVQEDTTIYLDSENADLVCWSTDVGFEPNDSLCHPDGSACVTNAVKASDAMPNVTTLNVPMTVKVEGCTSVNSMGVTSKSTVGPYEIGPRAATPRMTVVQDEANLENGESSEPVAATAGAINIMIKSGDKIQMDSVNSIGICWTHSTGDMEPLRPECSNDGQSCLSGQFSERTLSSLTKGVNILRTLKLSVVGCANIIPGVGGGQHSVAKNSTYLIVPQLEMPLLTPKRGTKFKNSQGKLIITGNQAIGGFCYVVDKATATTNDDSISVCPIQAPECRSNPPENKADKCINGNYWDVQQEDFTLSVLEDMTICIQTCSSSTTAGLHSLINVGSYSVLTGDKAQLAVLEDIYNTMNGKSGAWIYDWDLESYYCDLDGVECEFICTKDEKTQTEKCQTTHNIVKLNMAYVGLIGTTVDLSGLKYLNELSLAGNQISGNLPTFGAFESLSKLKLFYNKYDGKIPDDIGSKLLNIQELDLDHNQLTGTIPDSISKLVKLKSLDLSHNQLSGKIPPGLGELTQLTKLDLSNNNFEGDVPISLGNLTNLKKLNLDSNENLNIVLSDEVCDRTKQCMPPVDEDAASQRSVLAILSLVLSLSTWWIMM